MRQDRPRQLPVPAFSFLSTLFFLAPETVTSYSLRSLCFPYFLPKYGYQRTRTLFFQTHNTPCSGTAPGHTGDIPLRDTLPDSSFSYRPLRYLTYGSVASYLLLEVIDLQRFCLRMACNTPGIRIVRFGKAVSDSRVLCDIPIGHGNTWILFF